MTNNQNIHNTQLFTGFVIAAMAVAAGAFGAHGLKKIISFDAVNTWETAVRYQIYHAFAMIVCALLSANPEYNLNTQIPFRFFLAGIILFCIPVYTVAFREVLPVLKIAGAVAPLGGLCFISGWLWLAWKVISQKLSN